MSHNRLRGTWEEDPAPIPFPGRDAGAGESESARMADTEASTGTDALVQSVERELDRVSLKFQDLKSLLSPFDGDDGDDHPSAA